MAMKVTMLVLIIAALVLHICGIVLLFKDGNKEKRKKTSYLIYAIGSFLMAIFFVLLLIRGF